MNIAIVEDDINMRKSLEISLKEYKEFNITAFKNATEALDRLNDSYDLIVTDINMPKIDGIEFIKRLNSKYDVIVITGNATLNRAIESLRLGVIDFLTKPFDVETLVKAIKRNEQIKKIQAEIIDRRDERIDRRKNLKDARENPVERRKNRGDRRKKFLGTSSELEKILSLLQKVAKTDVSVMLLGESGVGKELFARYIHENSNRYTGPFVAINMAAIPENLLESELFGYEKGAFTDATSAKSGYFETANKGTLFLDEIAEMPIALQTKLLRVLQEREIVRVGGVKSIKIDVRIVSATNADIIENIDNKKFREDLYYRLNTIPVNIPALRKRKEEIIDIAEGTLKQICFKYQFEEKIFSQDAKKSLLEYNWPGNIRELISVIERAAILSEGGEIIPIDLFLESRSSKKSISIMEKELIEEVLISLNYDLDETSKTLGMSKTNLNKKIKKYDIEVKKK